LRRSDELKLTFRHRRPVLRLSCRDAASNFAVDGRDHFISRGETAVSYDHWKATNPADEQLGPEPLLYDAADNFDKSIDVAYEAVRTRVANGGWTPKERQ
jgi:hypothetical protein